MSLAPWVLSVLTVGLAAQAHVHASEAAAAPGYYTVQATGSTGWSSMDAKVEAVRETLLAAQVPGAIVALPVKAGDEFVLGDEAVTITAVGDLANPNLQELGHVVLYLNAEDTALLPGAIQATGTLSTPTEGAFVSVRRNEV